MKTMANRMAPREAVKDLLAWARRSGLEPNQVKSDDLYLMPYQDTLVKGKALKNHQVAHAYWIPSPDGLKELGFDCDMWWAEGAHVVRLTKDGQNYLGMGKEVETATLSAVNQIRRNKGAADRGLGKPN